MKIPTIAHFIWGNKNGVPYSRYLSVATFSHLNPEFKIFFHTFENTGGIPGFGLRGGETVCETTHSDHADRLANIPNLEIVVHTDLHGTTPDQAPTFLSDLLRYYLLGSIGGYYFDTDILFYKPMRESYLFSGMYTDITAVISHSRCFSGSGAYRIGVLASREKSRLFMDTYDVARWAMDPREYQSAGSEALQSVLGGASHLRKFDGTYPDEIIHNLLDSFAYRYNFESMKAVLPISSLEYLRSCFSAWIVCVHWYGGALSETLDRDMQVDTPVEGRQRFVDYLFELGKKIVDQSELTLGQSIGSSNK